MATIAVAEGEQTIAIAVRLQQPTIAPVDIRQLKILELALNQFFRETTQPTNNRPNHTNFSHTKRGRFGCEINLKT